MITRINYRMLLAAVSITALSSAAQADEVLCASSAFNPGTGEDWGAVCASGDWAYAEVQVSEAESTATVHVTDHGDCPGGTHLECGVASSFDGSTACVREEDNLDLPADGYLPAVLIFCGCYSTDCYGE